MAGLQYKAANIKPPVSDGLTAASDNQRFYTCDSTSRRDALPDTWDGKMIRITNTGSVGVWYYLTTNGTTTAANMITAAPTAADSGVLAANPERLGDYIGPGMSESVMVPSRVPTAANPMVITQNFLARASASSSPLAVRLASD